MRSHSLMILAPALALVGSAPSFAQSGTGELGWAPAFQDLTHQQAPGPFLQSTPFGRAFGAVEDGPLAGLYFAGEFGAPEDADNRVLRFADNASLVVGQGFPGNLTDVCAYDDGSGVALYVAFSAGASEPGFAGLRRWDGTEWEAIPVPEGHFYVFALTTWDDGSGEKLIAALSAPAGSEFAGLAAFDGQSWSTVGSGLFGIVEDLVVFQHGAQSTLIAGGNFHEVGSPPYAIRNIASFDGSTWEPLGEGSSSTVRTLQVHDDGRGPALYAGGTHYDSETNEAQYLRSWNGSQWRAVEGVNVLPLALASVEAGGHLDPGLYASVDQDFSTATEASFGLGRWDGDQWHHVGTGLPGSEVLDLQVYGEGEKQSLFAAFYQGGADSGDRGFARWGSGAAPRYVSVPGCGATKPVLIPVTGALDLGLPTSLQMFGDVGGAASTWYFFIGDDGADATGCGLELDGIGELLLDLAQPIDLFATAPANPLLVGSPVLHFTMPATPELAGLELGVQALGILVNGSPPRLSRSLVATLEFAP
ncbi:MAG: hypothetical protein ACYS26_03975 [Planctomycetota bacterium]